MNRIVAIILAIVALFLLIDIVEPNGYGFFAKVGTGKIAVVTSFGKTQDEVLEAGFHLKSFFDILNPMSVQQQTATSSFTAFSKDIQEINTTVTVNYNVDKATATTLFCDVGKNYTVSIIEPRLYENTKVVYSDYTAEQLITNREELSSRIYEAMKESLTLYGINVSAILIEDIDFTDAFTDAVEAKQVASQNKLTAQTQQETETIAANAAAERQIIAAQAEAEQRKIDADARAYETNVIAEAEAEANKKIAASVTEELIDYTKVHQWNGELPTITGDSTPIVMFEEEGG